MEKQEHRDQRPFQICPECNAHNAKAHANCWRCNHDMTKSALSPQGVLGYRLDQLESREASPPSSKK